MQRVVVRELPSGEICRVYPFHVCMKGTESTVLCRDDADYDAMVKIIAVAASRKNVIIIIYAKKMRLLPYVVRTRKTSAAQLSRIFGFKREVTEEAMRTLMKKQ